MSNTSLLGSYGAQDSSSLMFRNLFINGGFDIWQRGGSLGPFTDDQYVSDRWRIFKNDTVNYTVNLGFFALGQTDVPDNPRFFHSLVVNSIGSAVDFVSTSQRIEDVTRLAGRVVSLSFWAKADQALTINPPVGTNLGAITVIQNFGTGGSPSEQVVTIAQQSQALTTTWTKYTYTFTIPSISSKALGTDANSSYTQITILPATAGMGGRTIDISNAQIEFGPVATPFERRPYGTELALAQRYYYRVDSAEANGNYLRFATGSIRTATLGEVLINLPQKMRITPALESSAVGNFFAYSADVSNTCTGLILGGDGSSPLCLALAVSVASGLTAGRAFMLIAANNKTAWLAGNAEL